MFNPTNDLERSPKKAANNPAHRGQFVRDLLSAKFHAIVAGPMNLDRRDEVLQSGVEVPFKGWEEDGKKFAPIYLSLSMS